MPELLRGYQSCLENWTFAFADDGRGGDVAILLTLNGSE